MSGTHKVNMKASGGIHIPYEAVGYPLELIIIDETGNPVTFFSNPFTINIDFSNFDIDRLIKDGLSIYSSSDGMAWEKEDTSFDWENNLATARVNHASYFVLAGERADTIAPNTSVTLSGEEGQENWFRSDVEVSFTAEDNEGGFGVEYTSYKLDDGEWQEYKDVVTIIDEGEHKVEYYSVDNDENIEDVKSRVFYIDKTVPEARILFNPETLDTEIVGIDENEAQIEFFRKRFLWFLTQDTARITDLAGNTLEIEGILKFRFKKDFLTINRLAYNDADTNLETNIFSNFYIWRRDAIRYLQQSWYFKRETFVTILYFGDKNESWIYQGSSWKSVEKEVLPGIVLLYIETDKGNLNYGYE